MEWVWLLIALLMIPIGLLTASAATISGTVVDVSGKPIADVRIDHIGRLVVSARTSLAVKPAPGEVRTDAEGHFQVTTTTPAIVVRKPGYVSQRVSVTGDANLQIALQPVKPPTCKVERLPEVKTKQANDVDYTAKWIYIETKDGPKGIISGSGPTYSYGAPSDQQVWTSLDYFEVMYESGVIDARGHSADGKYWRLQTAFGEAAQYFGMNQATAEILDCILDRPLMRTP